MAGPSNRKKKSAVPQENPKIVELDNLQDFKDYVGHKDIPEKTLLEQIDATKKQEDAAKAHRKIKHPGGDNEDDGEGLSGIENLEDDEELDGIGKFMFAFLDYTAYMIPLLSVHLILNVLVRLQYGQETEVMEIVKETIGTIPVMLALFKICHPYRGKLIFKLISLSASLAIGCYLVYATNEEGYYYIMQRAPPLGTLWVWLFLEMDWQWSTLSLLLVGVWTWFRGYKI